MNIFLIIIIPLVMCCNEGVGQEPTILDPLTETSPLIVSNSEPPIHRIFKQTVQKRGGIEFVFNQVAPPRKPCGHPSITKVGYFDSNQIPISQYTFTVEAKTYAEGQSHVTWSSQNTGAAEVHTCWSNIDWENITPFHSFKVGEQRFYFLLFHTVSEAREALDQQPTLPPVDKGARYVILSGNEVSKSALDFIEGIHAIYDSKKDALQLSVAERKRKAKDQNSMLIKAPQRIELNFWPLTPEQKKR